MVFAVIRWGGLFSASVSIEEVEWRQKSRGKQKVSRQRKGERIDREVERGESDHALFHNDVEQPRGGSAKVRHL